MNNNPGRSTTWALNLRGNAVYVAIVGLTFAVSVLPRQMLAADESAKTVSLVVDYGDGVQKHFTALEWREKMTVLEAVRQAEKHARGIKCEVRGSGETAFLVKIDDIKNEGGGGRGWLFRVNGKLGDRSLGVFPIQAGDAVLWKFEKYR